MADDLHTEIFLGVPIHIAGENAIVDLATKWISGRKRPSAIIVQTNVFSLVSAAEDPNYRAILCEANLSLPDGMPLVWFLRRKGHSGSTRNYGPDLMLALCKKAAQSGWRCFFYGGEPGVSELLRTKLSDRYPGLNVVGVLSPPFRELTTVEEEEACLVINKSRPDILWVSLGGPKQDTWMYNHRMNLDVSVMHGVGAAFDFHSGRKPQAPRWMMNLGFEWVFRLMTEPRRLWKRYTLVNAKFLRLVFLELLRKGHQP